nr:copper chaperone PCu(A)C [uncultured Rhodopila sp.]
MMHGIIGRCALLAPLAMLAGSAFAAAPQTEAADAWTAAGGVGGGEALLYMTVTNRGAAPDALTRVRCPVAWASEPRTTDRGEGGLSSRAVKSIAIPPNATVKLEPGGLHVALLQLKEPLQAGQTFTCSVTFAGGPEEVPVRVQLPGGGQ